jgi:hypothetical protein
MSVRFYKDRSADNAEDCPIRFEFDESDELSAEKAIAVMLMDLRGLLEFALFCLRPQLSLG